MFYVHVLSDRSGRLTAGVTQDINHFLQEHRQTIAANCTFNHQFDRLLLVETFPSSSTALVRQQQLNRCTLSEKLEFIRAANPRFDDLAQTLQG